MNSATLPDVDKCKKTKIYLNDLLMKMYQAYKIIVMITTRVNILLKAL